MGLEVLCTAITSCWTWLSSSLYGTFIVMRKNLRLRRRRYMAFLMEMLAPIFIVLLVIGANNQEVLLRIQSLEAILSSNNKDEHDLQGFYELGSPIEETDMFKHNLCSLTSDPDQEDSCFIAYVADPATEDAIFKNTSQFRTYFRNNTYFIKFADEQRIKDCLEDAENCDEFNQEVELIKQKSPNSLDYKKPNFVLGFRGAVVFQTSVDEKEIKYKIRLMEKYFGSLRHVLKTGRMLPSIYDRRDYAASYIETGFLPLQVLIDRMIILHIKETLLAQDPNSNAKNIIFNSTTATDCTCEIKMHPIPHRQSDQFRDAEDPLDLSSDYEHDSETDDETKNENHDADEITADRYNTVNKQSLVVSTVLVLAFIFLLPSEQRRISSEKESGLTVLLLVTGMTHRMQWIGNLLAITVSYLGTVTIVVLLLTIRFNKTQGAVFEYASASVLWLLFFLYVMALASSCYMVTVFFHKPTMAITASVSIFLTAFIAPLYHLDYYYDIFPTSITLIACLHPCIAMQMALRLLIRFERHEIPTTLFTMTRYVPTDPLRIIFIVLILIFDTVLYMVLTIYFDRILKSKYGVNKPWYYLFMPSEYTSSSDNKVAPAKMTTRKSMSEVPGYEPSPDDAEPSVTTTNLTKKYGNVVAVSNLNIQLYHGEIFALLGHNGAGKTTMLNLFTGFTPPTSGTAKICGYDIRTHMAQIQAFTGMCPQQSWLYDDLTPYEHLVIFGRLRGLRGSEAYDESTELLEKLRIHEMAHWAVRKLSTGDKRKLSLAIALVGNPKVVCLDEPTGGLDYYSRRAVWDLLLKIRSNHTIIFSTHFMDEAELLGDRIGILASGKMEVCGSHAFLRRYFGLGYSLKIKMAYPEKPNLEEILNVVRGSIPNASLSTLPISPDANAVCTCNLPEEDYSTTTMSTLFVDLSRLKDALGIVGFTVSYATVEEVFLELARKLDTASENIAIPIENEETELTAEGREERITEMFHVKTKCFHSVMHFGVLLKKRMLHTWRNKRLLFFQVILPFLIYIVGVLRLSSHNQLSGRLGPPLELSLVNFKDSKILYHATEDTFITAEHIKNVIGSTATFTPSSDLYADYIHVEYDELRNRHFCGLSADTGSVGQLYVHYSPYIMHSAPIAMNLYSNVLVNYMDTHRKICTTNHPLQNPYFHGTNVEADPHASDVFAMMSTLSASLTVSFCSIYPLQERLTGVKHLQLMAGVSSFVYWSSNLFWDFMLIVFETACLLTITFIYPPLGLLAVVGSRHKTSIGINLMLITYWYSGLMLSYAFSQFARSKSGAFALLVTITLLFGVIIPFLIFGLGTTYVHADDGVTSLFLMIPVFAFGSALRKYALTLLGNGRCDHFTPLGAAVYCRTTVPQTEIDTRKLSCCLNCPTIPGTEHCYEREDLVRTPWTNSFHSYKDKERFATSHTRHPVPVDGGHESRQIFYEVLYMTFVGLALNTLVVFFDSDKWKYMLSCMHGERGTAFQTNVEDEDVIDEMDLVERMVDAKETDQEALVAHNLCKSYAIYPALHNLSFTVHPGEVFGIIGVNAAGKSTLFSLLTGSMSQSYGNVYSVDCNMNSKRHILLRKMGYLPQQDIAMFEYMTCSENLVHFGRLRALKATEAKDICNKLLKKVGLEKFANTRVSHLSGGTKRRLGTAIAIVGKPPIILFDEPTSAADPASRRCYWEVIKDLKKTGHTIILSSHRIHECEDLSERMVIMVDGKFQCIGSPNHLKEKFGSGFKLIVKLIPGPAESQGYVSSLSESIVKTFNPCSLRDRRRNVIQYVIHDASVPWDYLFQMMEHIKLRYNDLVEDYAFSNTTLEEVFLSFVVLQNCGRILDSSEGCLFCI